MIDYEAIMKIKSNECESQPVASEDTKQAYSVLYDALDDYINAVQNDAFYFGYITAMKQIRERN